MFEEEEQGIFATTETGQATMSIDTVRCSNQLGLLSRQESTYIMGAFQLFHTSCERHSVVEQRLEDLMVAMSSRELM